MADRKRRACASGFTLIELMIVVAAIAILAAVAAPSYMNSVRKSRRTDAKTFLLDLAGREERYFSTHNAYSSAPSDLGYSGAWPLAVPSTSTYNYGVTVTLPAGGGFLATAAANGDQTNDACGSYSIDNTGAQTNGGSLTSAQCW